MPKRKLEDADEEDNAWQTAAGGSAKIVDPEKKKHSLDSDEEESDEDDQRYHILSNDDITGQEEGTSKFDGEVQITPFNMKEEMEEGHFDAEGHYHFKKDPTEGKDHWLDNIDWIKIKNKETDGAENPYKLADDSSSDEEMGAPFNKIETYKKIMAHMKAGETVATALRRLGSGQTLSASQKLKMKKMGQKVDNSAGDKTMFLALTDLANGMLIATGNMNVYQETFEQISRTVAAAEAKIAKTADPLDIFGEDFDSKQKDRLAVKPEESKSESKDEASSSGVQAGSDVVQWEFKWTEDADEVHGPHTSEQMQEWVTEGYFKDTVCVRKVGSGANFYSTRRVDFDLYI